MHTCNSPEFLRGGGGQRPKKVCVPKTDLKFRDPVLNSFFFSRGELSVVDGVGGKGRGGGGVSHGLTGFRMGGWTDGGGVCQSSLPPVLMIDVNGHTPLEYGPGTPAPSQWYSGLVMVG